MANHRLILVSALLLCFVSGCSKDDKDPMRDWEKPSNAKSVPKPGRVLVEPPDKDLDPWSHWKKEQRMPTPKNDWTEPGHHKPVPKPGHVLVK